MPVRLVAVLADVEPAPVDELPEPAGPVVDGAELPWLEQDVAASNATTAAAHAPERRDLLTSRNVARACSPPTAGGRVGEVGRGRVRPS